MTFLKIPCNDVRSSVIGAIGYDAERRICAVRFRTGRIRHYADVPEDVAREFVGALSVGQFYNQYIRTKYPSEAMTADCPQCGAHGWIGETCEDCGCAEYTALARHYVTYDEPTAKASRRKTVCGLIVPGSQTTTIDADITCPACVRERSDKEVPF